MATPEYGAPAQPILEQGSAPAQVFERMLQAGQIGFQRCTACDARIFPPRVLCPECGGVALEWRQSAGHGSVYATTTVHERGRDPYNVALVDVAEGFRLMSRIEGLPSDDVTIGLRVRLRVGTMDGAPECSILGEPVRESR